MHAEPTLPMPPALPWLGFSVGNALSQGWELMKRRSWLKVGIVALSTGWSIASSLIESGLQAVGAAAGSREAGA
jgi:hypothetical protein